MLYRTADILPINVDALRTGAVERGLQICRAMVDAGVKTELTFNIAAFVGPAGNTDGACARALGELAGNSANRPRSGRYDGLMRSFAETAL